MAARGDSDTIMGYNYKDYADGSVYEGNWKDGKRYGAGKYTFASGNMSYDGYWKDDKRHGEGENTSANGDVYDGYWRGDKMHGEGKMTYADGSVYEGNWKDDKPNRKSFAKVLVSEVFKSAGKAAASAGFAALGLGGI